MGEARRRSEAIAVAVLLLLGAGLRTAQYLGRVSLWHDELALARNVEDRDLVELITRPLEHLQVAPAGFLAALEVGTWVAGPDELGLRLVPWLCSLCALFLFWRVAGRFASGGPRLSGLALFAVSPALTWYGASAKQYGADVAVSLLLVWLALRFRERRARLGHALGAGAAGGAAVLFSHPAVVTALLLGGILLVEAWRERRQTSLVPLAAMSTGWAFGAALAAAVALTTLDPETRAYMREFWGERGGFPPPLSAGLAVLAWAPRQAFGAFAHFLLFITPPILVAIVVTLPAALALVGLVDLARRSPWRAALLAAPVAAGLAAAAAGLLPFRHRAALHAGWPILVLAMAGIEALRARLPARASAAPTALAVLMAAPLALMVLLGARPPYLGQESRPVLEEFARRRQPGDDLYVFCGGRHAVAFYGPRVGLEPGTQGGCHHGEPRAYFEEVDAFRGHPRVWFFYTQSHDDEAGAIRSYFESIGRQRDAIPDPAGNHGESETAAYLYDLSDPELLRATTAAAFVPPPREGR